MKRKTINVSELTAMVNSILKDSGPEFSDVRQGSINVLEAVLHKTGNYRGFQYLGAESVPAGSLPGVNWGFKDDFEAAFFNTDNTRRQYIS